MFTENEWFIAPDVRKREIAGKTILLTIKTNRLLVLNKQASIIWNQLTNGKKHGVTDIIKILQSKYSATPHKILQRDVHNFLLDLQDKGFVYQNDKSLSRTSSSVDKKSNVSGHLSFSEQLHHLAVQYNIPVAGTLEITQRCQLKCIHCYLDDRPIDKTKELSTEEIHKLLQQMVKSGCLWLLITGGEPLIRSDFCEIYRYAKDLGMIITVFTSATNITERIADLFCEYPPFLIEATLHGATEKTFDSISRTPGAFKQFQKGIQLLQKRKVSFHLKTIVMKQNFNEVEATRQLAIDMGAENFRFDPMINADFFHSSKALDLRISVEDALKLDMLEPYRIHWERIYRTAIKKRRIYRFSDKLLFPCRAGKCSFAISSDGRLLPCILIRVPYYDLRETLFMDAWREMNRFTTITKMREDNQCLRCSVQTCSKCPAWGYLEHGDLNTKSWFACALQREREKTFLK
ncbi:MAG: PqqD family peptide modification chaperone [Candidatus Omnitrophota bacterium]|nr:PqqD family peptide modification chaperone [Candidatus Omnitrophota bacterium]